MKIRLKVLKGSCVAQKLPRPDGRYYIGRAETCHFRVSDPEVASRHCAIRLGKSRIVMRALEGRPTYVNGLVVSERCELTDGDVITVGQTKFCLLIVEDQVATDPMGGEVSQWLAEEDERERQLRALDPDARRYFLASAASGKGASQSADGVASNEASVADAAVDSNKPAKKSPPPKRPPQKLPPPPPTPPAPTSHDAASEVLDKMFYRPPRDKRY